MVLRERGMKLSVTGKFVNAVSMMKNSTERGERCAHLKSSIMTKNNKAHFPWLMIGKPKIDSYALVWKLSSCAFCSNRKKLACLIKTRLTFRTLLEDNQSCLWGKCLLKRFSSTLFQDIYRKFKIRCNVPLDFDVKTFEEQFSAQFISRWWLAN